jgi:PAS domain-containing protein
LAVPPSASSPASSGLAHRFSRVVQLFAALTALVLLASLLAWRALGQAQDARDDAVRMASLLADLHAVDAAAASPASRWLCLASGQGAMQREDVAASAWGIPLATMQERLSAVRPMPSPHPVDARAVDDWRATVRALRQGLDAWEQTVEGPLRTACLQAQRLTPTDVQARWRAAQPARARLEASFASLREPWEAHRQEKAALSAQAAKASRAWLLGATLLALGLGLASVLMARGFLVRSRELQRRVHDESSERAAATESLAISQRRMRVLVDHVKDAVVAFDGEGHIQWINPAGEAMFGLARHKVLGYPVTLLMPELEGELTAASAPEHVTMVDEHGLPWVSRSLTLQGVRATPGVQGSSPRPGVVTQAQTRFTLDVSFMQTRVDGHVVGVCVARDLSEVRRLQRDMDQLRSSLRHTLLPQAQAATVAAQRRDEAVAAAQALQEPVLFEASDAAPAPASEATQASQAVVDALASLLGAPSRSDRLPG